MAKDMKLSDALRILVRVSRNVGFNWEDKEILKACDKVEELVAFLKEEIDLLTFLKADKA